MFGSDKAIEVLTGQIKVLQDEKRELWNKIFALLARNQEEYHLLASTHEPAIADGSSPLYEEPEDEEYKVGEVIARSTEH